MFEKIFLFENLEIFQTGAACQRASSESRAMLAGFDRGSDLFFNRIAPMGMPSPKGFALATMSGRSSFFSGGAKR